jgi:DNA polymerase IV
MGTELKPWFALIDMNSYFATLEQQANPLLRGKPVVIVKEAGRSCVIAASKEAKKLGVKTGEMMGPRRKLLA